MTQLAIEGGTPVRTAPMPARALIGPEEREAALRVFDQAIATGVAFGYNGEHEQRYEHEFAGMLGGGFAIGVNSGTNALFAALGGLQLDALAEVIVPAITDPGGIMPVIFAGCVPVVADCDPRTFNTSAEQIAAVVTERTRAIVVAHIGGDPVDLDPVMELARRYKLHVVEDCAQAQGARYKGRPVGTCGDVAVFSTMFGKHYCTGGQGGMVFTRDEELAWRVRRFADRGKPFHLPETGNVVAGLNCNLSELAAAIGCAQLKKLPWIVQQRRQVGEAIKRGTAECQAVSVGWQVPQTESSYWFLRMKLDTAALRVSKEQFCAALAAEGIPVEASYRHVPAAQPWFVRKATFGTSGFPWNCSDYRGSRTPVARLANAERVIAEHFNIAIHERYGSREIEDILTALRKVATAYAL